MAAQASEFSSTDLVKGIDVSHHQGRIDWTQVATAGFAFCYAKATQGTRFKDIRYREHLEGSTGAGLLTGAYHFFSPDVDAEAQADSFLHVVSQAGHGELPPMLDVEVDAGASAQAISAGMQSWLDAVENVLGQRPIIYTSASFWNTKLRRSTQFSDYLLWVAHYTVKPAPAIPNGFGDYVLWQFTSQGRVPGIATDVDLDRFNGSLEYLTALASR